MGNKAHRERVYGKTGPTLTALEPKAVAACISGLK
jgi:hypothetical protein